MARRGRDQITVRLEDDILEELRPLVRADRGRAGGLSFYLRRLIYQDLGRPLPEQFGRETEDAWFPRLATRLEHWLETDPDEREELLEAAGLLARRLGLELVKPAELEKRKRAGTTRTNHLRALSRHARSVLATFDAYLAAPGLRPVRPEDVQLETEIGRLRDALRSYDADLEMERSHGAASAARVNREPGLEEPR